MAMFAMNTMMTHRSTLPDSHQLVSFRGWKSSGIYSTGKPPHANMCRGLGAQTKAFVLRKSEKKLRNNGKTSRIKTLQRKNLHSEDSDNSSVNSPAGDGGSGGSFDSCAELFSGDSGEDSRIAPKRSDVLQACIVTSGLLLAVGALVRQASHFASMQGWAILDASELSFDFEMWHIQLIIGLVVLVSSCRYILLKTWPGFAESSESANQQVLSLLHPLDYITVAFLPGISEELLFRGALLPLFGLNWKSAMVIGAVFGGLHLGSGRKYSFAVWATIVGFAYGLATIISSSIIVPMAAHSLSNLVGGMLWRYTSNPMEKHR